MIDDTQVDQVFWQWKTNGVSEWKIPLLRRVLEGAPFSGKVTTPWTPESVHDFMHAKVVVADDTSFVGSFNFSRSGERNAENVLEIKDREIADRLAAFVDEIRGRYPPATPPGELALARTTPPRCPPMTVRSTQSVGSGLLVLADISGYTSFLQAVTLAHRNDAFADGAVPDAYAVISSLLDGIVERLAPPLTLAKLEGDAVFAYEAASDRATSRARPARMPRRAATGRSGTASTPPMRSGSAGARPAHGSTSST